MVTPFGHLFGRLLTWSAARGRPICSGRRAKQQLVALGAEHVSSRGGGLSIVKGWTGGQIYVNHLLLLSILSRLERRGTTEDEESLAPR